MGTDNTSAIAGVSNELYAKLKPDQPSPVQPFPTISYLKSCGCEINTSLLFRLYSR